MPEQESDMEEVDVDNFLQRYSKFAKTIGWDLAKSVWWGLWSYLIAALTKAYVLGYPDIKAHNFGIVAGLAVFLMSIFIYGIKNKWLKQIMKKGD